VPGIILDSLDIKSYNEPAIVESEILRYAKCDSGIGVSVDEEMLSLMRECVIEFRSIAKYNVIYKVAKVAMEQSTGDIAFDFGDSLLNIVSKDLAGNFARNESNYAVFFAATLGHEMDRLIRKYSAISPTKALFMQAIGAERIEALCDAFEKDVKVTFSNKAPRFSPGFGDLKLDMQRDFARILDLDKKIGIKVGQNLLMSPTKSVTAIIGVSSK